jgi:DNA-binding winged helix-turn-helix (wHTH) protein/TolB-like protein
VRFGEFTVDLAAGEVHKNGVKIRLQELPFRVLAALASRPGQVVTREELRARLWDASTFVDAEAGLNTAVAKLREALGDSAEAPIFIETIPKRGYRFIAAVEQTDVDVHVPGSTVHGAQGSGGRGSQGFVGRGPNGDGVHRFRVLGVVALAAAIVALAAFAIQHARSAEKVTIAVVLFHNETGDPAMDRLAQQLTDASVIALTANPNYAVIGNAAILRTPRIFADLKQIGEQLHADYMLVAQVQNPPQGLTIRVHFIRADDQKHLWATGIAGPPDTLEQQVVETVRSSVAASLGK